MTAVSAREAAAASQERAGRHGSALRRRHAVVVALLLIVLGTAPARGGEMLLDDAFGNSSGWKAAWAPSLDPYVSIMVDMVTIAGPGTVGEVFIRKMATFIQGPGPGGFPTIPITFSQVSPDAVGRIVINGETITNNTGVAWTGFHFRLLPRSNATFNPTLTGASGGSTGFSTAPFNNQTFSPDNSSFLVDGFGLGPNGSNRSVPSGSQWLPGDGAGDGELIIDAVPRPSEPFTVFSLKETPLIPEPATLLLAVFGAAVLLPRRGRR